MSVPHLKHAYRRGLGEADLRRIEILGDGIPRSVKPFQFIPRASYWWMRLGIKLEKLGRYTQKIGEFAFMVGNALAALGYETLAKKLTVGQRLELAKRWAFKLNI